MVPSPPRFVSGRGWDTGTRGAGIFLSPPPFTLGQKAGRPSFRGRSVPCTAALTWTFPRAIRAAETLGKNMGFATGGVGEGYTTV